MMPVFRMPLFGPVLLLGEGGTAVELKSSHAVALPPLNARLAQDLIDRSRLGPLLAGYRGQTAANAAALTETLLKVSLLACDMAQAAELDINPLIVMPKGKGVKAADALIRMKG